MSRTYFLTAVSATILAVGVAACSTPPKDLDLSLKHPTAQGRFVVEMEPPERSPTVNQMHAWTVKVTTPDGTPVTQARIGVDGGMPQHGHGLPTKPRVTRELAPGAYLVEGMKFSMTGWWGFKLDIDTAGARDTVAFNVVLDESGLKR